MLSLDEQCLSLAAFIFFPVFPLYSLLIREFVFECPILLEVDLGRVDRIKLSGRYFRGLQPAPQPAVPLSLRCLSIAAFMVTAASLRNLLTCFVVFKY